MSPAEFAEPIRREPEADPAGPLEDRPEVVFVGGPAHGRCYRIPPDAGRFEVPQMVNPADVLGDAPIMETVAYHRFRVEAGWEGSVLWRGEVMLCQYEEPAGSGTGALLMDALSRAGMA